MQTYTHTCVLLIVFVVLITHPIHNATAITTFNLNAI